MSESCFFLLDFEELDLLFFLDLFDEELLDDCFHLLTAFDYSGDSYS